MFNPRTAPAWTADAAVVLGWLVELRDSQPDRGAAEARDPTVVGDAATAVLPSHDLISLGKLLEKLLLAEACPRSSYNEPRLSRYTRNGEDHAESPNRLGCDSLVFDRVRYALSLPNVEGECGNTADER